MASKPSPLRPDTGGRRSGVTAARASRGRATLALSVLALALTSGGTAQAQLRFRFKETPSQAESAAALPGVGAEEEPAAAAICDAEFSGQLSNCRVLHEEPAARGVGEALIGLAPRFRLGAMTGACARYFPQALIMSNFSPTTPSMKVRRTTSLRSMWESYPEAARELSIQGAAVVHCEILPKGEAGPCRILFETPNGAGFGDAAARIAQGYKFKPTGAPAGKTPPSFVLPINFIPNQAVRMNCPD